MADHPNFDQAGFRRVMGHYPTEVRVTTATAGEERAGMVVGSCTSVPLDPPLMAFFPDKQSSTWPMIAATDRFCINILGGDQADLCGRIVV